MSEIMRFGNKVLVHADSGHVMRIGDVVEIPEKEYWGGFKGECVRVEHNLFMRIVQKSHKNWGSIQKHAGGIAEFAPCILEPAYILLEIDDE